MSWDLFVQDIPSDVQSVDDLPEDYAPKPLGRRSDLITRIREVVPNADFTRPEWGVIDGPGYSIEVNMGEEEVVESFAFHVRGADAAADAVASILNHLGLRAMDPASSTGVFGVGSNIQAGPRSWRKYLIQIFGKMSS